MRKLKRPLVSLSTHTYKHTHTNSKQSVIEHINHFPGEESEIQNLFQRKSVC